MTDHPTEDHGPGAVHRILSIDGGGIMGTYPASFLASLEDDLGRPIGEYFDLIAGTSTGGILAIGLALGLPARTLLDLYVARGPRIFGQTGASAIARLREAWLHLRHVVAPKHDADVLRAELDTVLGTKRIGDAKQRLLIPAWDADHRSVYIYKTAHHERLKTDYKCLAVDAAMATAAAPSYFRRHRTADDVGLLDGGVWANNPIALAVVEAIALLGWPADSLRILSLGCVNEVYALGEAPGWGQLARDVTRLFMDGQSHGALGMAKLLTGHVYERESIYRVCPDVPKGFFKMDDTRRIGQLKGMGASAARRERPRIEPIFLSRPAAKFEPIYNGEGAHDMNQLHARETAFDHALLRKSEIYTLLDEIGRDLELRATQAEAAKVSYEAVGEWLSTADDPVLRTINIFAHGSTALGTTVKPLHREEHDVDLICRVHGFSQNRFPAELKRIVGERLRENARYAPMLQEKSRCWRLNYERQFHLDISPTIPNPACANGGELVPDNKLRNWKPTNPKGYKTLFERRAALSPRMRLQKAVVMDRAAMEPFPASSRPKGILRRTVQLLKRDRDIQFQHVEEDVAPISIIITTLAARAYEYCVRQFEYDTELDVLCSIVRMMPHFIERRFEGGRQIYVIENETTEGENFAERWNSEPERAKAFFAWHKQALENFERLGEIMGMDILTRELQKSFGPGAVRRVVDERTNAISRARVSQSLFVAPAVGLTQARSAQATQVRPNTNFGDGGP